MEILQKKIDVVNNQMNSVNIIQILQYMDYILQNQQIIRDEINRKFQKNKYRLNKIRDKLRK